MDLIKENDFIANVKTPTTCDSLYGSPVEHKVKCVSQEARRSMESVTYSDSFDDDSPEKPIIPKRPKYINKAKCYKSTTFYRKTKVSVYGVSRVSKPSETTQKLLESNKLKINELLSEKADYHRQLLEKTNELKTLQNQNKIQEKYLQKINSRDADVPNIISRYNSEVHSLQELLRRNKEKLDLSNKQKREIEIDLNKAKLRNERLSSLCDNNEQHEKEDLIKKIRTLTDQLETKAKKYSELERSIELMTKKHKHKLCLEVSKYKELSHSYKDILLELREVRNMLKEKTKLLEMQNIYSKVIVKPPHHLVRVTAEKGDDDQYRDSVGYNSATRLVKPSHYKEENEPLDRSGIHKSYKLERPNNLKKVISITSTVKEKGVKTKRGSVSLRGKKNVSLIENNPPEMSVANEMFEKSHRFSDLHQTVLKNMQVDLCGTHDTDSVLRLKHIDDNHRVNSQNHEEVKGDVVTSGKYEKKEIDVFCSSESDNSSSEETSGDSSSCLFQSKSPGGLKGSLRRGDKQGHSK